MGSLKKVKSSARWGLHGIRKLLEIQHGILFYSVLFGMLTAVSAVFFEEHHIIPEWALWIASFALFRYLGRYKIGFFTRVAAVGIILIAIFLLLGSRERAAAIKIFRDHFKDFNAVLEFIWEVFKNALFFSVLLYLLS